MIVNPVMWVITGSTLNFVVKSVQVVLVAILNSNHVKVNRMQFAQLASQLAMTVITKMEVVMG